MFGSNKNRFASIRIADIASIKLTNNIFRLQGCYYVFNFHFYAIAKSGQTTRHWLHRFWKHNFTLHLIHSIWMLIELIFGISNESSWKWNPIIILYDTTDQHFPVSIWFSFESKMWPITRFVSRFRRFTLHPMSGLLANWSKRFN